MQASGTYRCTGPQIVLVESADRGTLSMKRTIFPATPGDVARLSVQEFTFDLDDLDGNRVPSMERVCRTFMDDANRALVWWIRFAALKNWCARTEVMARLIADAWTLRDACEVAASFPLNHRWEFDSAHFESAIDARTVGRRRGADR
jgi:hypothetical protein